ncbi:MAG: helix-turn-helix transcriptional regulator [Oscillospiraceae bacterium]|nr:helix-turn-helix transcriptional regulator [Oscillospiraceae bacterium]
MKTDEIYLRKFENGCIPLPPIEITTVFTLFLRRCQAPFVFSGELHDLWEILYVRRGNATVTADDKVYHLSSGSVIFHKPMEFHQIYADEPGLEIFVSSFNMTGELSYKFKGTVFELLPEEVDLFEELISRCVTLNNGCFSDTKEWDCKPLWSAASLEFYICIHMLEYILCLLQTRSPVAPALPATADSILYQKAVAILEEHIYSNITIQEVAELCGVSASSVKTCFSRHAGCGLHKYFLKIKIRAAIRLIKKGQSISSVSDTLGFNNPNYFSYVFQRETGKRPTDYRKNV